MQPKCVNHNGLAKPSSFLGDCQDYAAALAELRDLAEGTQQADVYNLLGFTLRKTGDFKTSLTYCTKALELEPEHKAARECLGELYVETGNIAKAKEQLDVLARLCPGGCEEREDLERAINAKSASNLRKKMSIEAGDHQSASRPRSIEQIGSSAMTLAFEKQVAKLDDAVLLASRLLLAWLFVHEGLTQASNFSPAAEGIGRLVGKRASARRVWVCSVWRQRFCFTRISRCETSSCISKRTSR